MKEEDDNLSFPSNPNAKNKLQRGMRSTVDLAVCGSPVSINRHPCFAQNTRSMKIQSRFSPNRDEPYFISIPWTYIAPNCYSE